MFILLFTKRTHNFTVLFICVYTVYAQVSAYISIPDLCFILLQQPACTGTSRVISQVEHDHALSLPTDKGAIYHAFYHGKKVFVAMVARGDHRECSPIELFQNFKNDVQLKGSGAKELQVDRANFLKRQKREDNLRHGGTNT